MSNSSIWTIDRTFSGATTPDQSGPGSDGSEGVLHFSQSPRITGALLSDCFMSYLGHSSAGVQLLYSTAAAYWAFVLEKTIKLGMQLVILALGRLISMGLDC